MSRRDFRIGWRLLIRQPVQSGIELLGLAAGFAICFLMLGFARYSFDYDRDVPQREQVYLIKHRLNFIPQPQWMEYTPFALREVAQHSGLPLEVSAWWPRQAVASIQNMPLKIEVTLVDPAFERIAGLRALQGDLQQALTQPNALALTEGSARRLFGDEAALGRTLDINGQRVTVRAILPDRPANSTLQFGVLAGVSSALWSQQELREGLANWMSIAGRIYVKTAPGVRPEALQQVLQGVIDRAPWGDIATPAMKAALGERKMVDIALGPLADAYFDRSVANTMGTGARGDRRLVLAMAAAGLLILALAALNYINLAAMRVVRRQREIAVRRVLGAGTGRLLSQFMAEAVMLSGAAAAVGLLLAWLLLPVASTLLGHTLDGMFTPATIVACLVLGVLLGVVAGLYPGWLARGVDMRSALNLRSSETAGGAWLRRILTALQFGAAMAMGGIALAIVWQTRFAAEANAGIDATPLLVVEMPESIDQPRAAAFRDALARLPGVAAVADSRNVPGRDDGSGTRGSTTVQRDDGSSTALAVQWVGADFFKVYGVTALAGQLFDSRMKPGSIPAAQPGAAQTPEQGVVLNDAAVRALGWPSAAQAIGQSIHGTGYRVLGVAPDIRWQTLREPAGPLMYQIAQDSRLLTLRMAPGHSSVQLEPAIVATASRYFSMPLPAIRSAGSYPALAYAADLRLAQMLGSATLVLLALAAFGVYAMAAVGVQRKTREIVLRKLHGAGRRAIARLVGREFVLLTASAALLGLPLAVLGIERYLAPFVAHSPLCGWAPLAALALAGLTVLLAAARHTLAALRLPPLQALRD